MSYFWLRVCTFGGMASAFVFFLGFWPFADFLPAIPPTWTEAQVVEHTKAHVTGIKVFAICFMYAGAFIMLFYAAISHLMSRIEGRFGPLSAAQLIMGVMATIPFVYGPVLWGAMAFRPDRSPELIYLLSDINWLATFFYGGPAVIQYTIIGICILSDKREKPILPRWAGYFNIWCATLNLPTGIMMFFKEGIFAWNGLFVFWIPSLAYAIWVTGNVFAMLPAIRREEAAEKAAAAERDASPPLAS